MILINSITLDNTTNNVIDWFFSYKLKFIRINSDSNYNYQINNHIYIDNLNINIFKSYWYRKGGMDLKHYLLNSNNIATNYLEENKLKILQFIEYQLCKKTYLNTYFNANPNKLLVLEKAKELKLLVPNFTLTNNLKKYDTKFIYKPINEGSHLLLCCDIASTYTNLFNNTKEQTYGLTFFQELIEKKYELRIFYLDGRFFSMAIFSQKDKQTEIDFRHYNNEKPNRNVPFQLPKEIEKKLNKLMKNLDLKSGSIDMIVSKDGEYYFLEVNPVGQFGMVSYPCNYHLEKEIAEYLSYE